MVICSLPEPVDFAKLCESHVVLIQPVDGMLGQGLNGLPRLKPICLDAVAINELEDQVSLMVSKNPWSLEISHGFFGPPNRQSWARTSFGNWPVSCDQPLSLLFPEVV